MACSALRTGLRSWSAAPSSKQRASAAATVTRASLHSAQPPSSLAAAVQTTQYAVRRKRSPKGQPLADFMAKLQLAWTIFFPEPVIQAVSSKEEVKKRLRLVLVADRCGMDPASLFEMKRTIVRALQEFVDIESEEGIEVSISNDPALGAVYSVTIPVRRVKAGARLEPGDALDIGADLPEGVSLEWESSSHASAV